MHNGAFQYISFIYRVSAPSVPKISLLPVLDPTEKISNTHTYIHTYIRTHSPLLYRLHNLTELTIKQIYMNIQLYWYYLYNNRECVRMYVCVLLIFSVGSRTGRTLIFGILGALYPIDIGNILKSTIMHHES